MEFFEKMWSSLKSAFSGATETIGSFFSGFGGSKQEAPPYVPPQQATAGQEYVQPQQRMAYEGPTLRQQQYPNGAPVITDPFNRSAGQPYTAGVTPSAAYQQGGIAGVAGSIVTNFVGDGLRAFDSGVGRLVQRTQSNLINRVIR